MNRINRRKAISLSLFVIMLSLTGTGCASLGKTLKGWLGGDTSSAPEVKEEKDVVGKVDKQKNYKRTDRQSLEEKSKLGADSGSLWIERGQGSYLFAQNTNRLIGDLINVEIDGHPKKQIETKVAVIQELIDKIKNQSEQRKLASQNKDDGSAAKPKAAAKPAAGAPGDKEANSKFDVKLVPARIVDILKDGSYQIQGDQTFMIGKREYKLTIKGIVRQEDFDDQGISAETLLDPQFDIITNRKTR